MENKQPELRYKDGTPIRKYNSPKLQAIEMENKQLTAVEWLIEKFTECGFTFSDNIFEQAKKMEEEQMENLRPQITSNCNIKEIADEDIKRKIKKEYNYTHYEDRLWMVQGAVWYKEQLKKMNNNG